MTTLKKAYLGIIILVAILFTSGLSIIFQIPSTWGLICMIGLWTITCILSAMAGCYAAVDINKKDVDDDEFVDEEFEADDAAPTEEK